MSYQVIIEPIGETIEVEEDQTILDAILRAGLYIPYQCGHGLCSTCKVDVLEGEVELGNASPFALMDFERDEGKALACCAKPRSDLVIEADIEEDPDSLAIPVRDYEAQVAELIDLTPDIKGVYLDVGGEGVVFQAGQYINLSLPGIEGPRAFSIASPPSQPGRLELHVRLVAGGAATSYIHNKLAIGDRVRFSAPMGHFFVRKSADMPCIFIAGGSGLSSPKSMVLDLLEEGFDKPLWLFHGVRTKADIYFADLFNELAARHPNF
ncbi:MAG: phenol hydroxylase, partial [Alphaproteobacteria bacterium]